MQFEAHVYHSYDKVTTKFSERLNAGAVTNVFGCQLISFAL